MLTALKAEVCDAYIFLLLMAIFVIAAKNRKVLGFLLTQNKNL
jgi:hypothetical protein